jgi:hypothetical protein
MRRFISPTAKGAVMPGNKDMRHPDLVGGVHSMAAAVVGHGSGHPEFEFKILDGSVLRTLHIDLAREGSEAIVAIVSAAYLLRKPLHIGLSGARPGDVAWVELSKPALAIRPL